MSRTGLAPALAASLAAVLVLVGCAPEHQAIGPAFTQPALRGDTVQGGDALQTADGTLLPLRVWLPAGKPKAVILGLHGMNDYAKSFAIPAAAWRQAGIAVYAYDQRGFGGTAQRGVWPGTAALTGDFAAAVTVLRARHPGVPIFAAGSSMGGGVILAALARPDAPRLDGVILAAPAVWSRATMPVYYTASLWLAAHTVPDMHFTGRGLRRVASDNREVLRDLGRDPMVLKGAPVASLWGVVELMDRAYAAAPRVAVPTLLLYGENDQIIPRRPIEDIARRLPAGLRRVALYPRGWHLLFRDLGAAQVHGDVAAWIADRAAPLPSGADRSTGAAQLARNPAVAP